MPKALVNFAIYCLLGAIVWGGVIVFVTVGSGLSDGAGNQLTRSGFAALCAPLRPAIAILVVADALLLMFVFACFHLGKMTAGTLGEMVGMALACAFTAIGIAGHRLLWSAKRRNPEE